MIDSKPQPMFLIRHWEFFVSVACAVVLSLWADTIKAFVMVSPQRVSIWLLKSRINASTVRLAHWKRLNNEPSYADHRWTPHLKRKILRACACRISGRYWLHQRTILRA
jgi:hypothetical protein